MTRLRVDGQIFTEDQRMRLLRDMEHTHDELPTMVKLARTSDAPLLAIIVQAHEAQSARAALPEAAGEEAAAEIGDPYTSNAR